MNTSRRGRGRLAAGLGLLGAAATVSALAAAPAQAEEGRILSAGSPNAVADSYIVVLKDGVADRSADVAAKADGLASRFGGKVSRSFSTALNGFSVHMSEANAKKLAADSSVDYVQANQKFHATEVQDDPPSWGLDRVDQRDLPGDKKYNYSTKAENVTAFVIDTGVRASHKTFEGRVSGGYDAIDNDDNPDDGYGHGTHVAGTIGGAEYGLAKGVKITPVRVLGDDGSGTTEQVVAGIDWVTANHSGPSVANMSLGGPVDQALDDSVKGAIEGGVPFVVAAGNDSKDADTQSPARVETAITVAASDDADNQADFSNFGKLVDLYAPGVDITSSWNDSDTGTDTISGTSMATPHVVGAAALYLADHPDASPADLATALTEAATPDKIQNPSEGTPNKLLYTGS